MSYEKIEQLPSEITENMPQGAQQIFWAAYKAACSDGIKEAGIAIATTIILLWAITLLISLSANFATLNLLQMLLLVVCQTFFNTGLFITAHDAIHGLVCPQNRKINNLFGSLAVSFYAIFSYKLLREKHWLHHSHPASELDPDFHDGEHDGFFTWYFHFMQGYWNWNRFTLLLSIIILVSYILHIALIKLILFWLIPLFLSSLQLFYFGTFLTHRQPLAGYYNSHRTQSNKLAVFWSLITCYHFGYHLEHHEYPNLPWWKLPEIYQKTKNTEKTEAKSKIFSSKILLSTSKLD
jgi:beta-carotene/zeaxanthin 4-ketolase